jgi:hypothetical protein
MNTEQPADELDQIFQEIAAARPDALFFLRSWRGFCEGANRIFSEPALKEEEQMAAMVLGPILCSNPFYQAHATELQVLVVLAANSYMDFLALEESEEEKVRHLASVLRFNFLELVLATAYIGRGYHFMRQISPRLRKYCAALLGPL